MVEYKYGTIKELQNLLCEAVSIIEKRHKEQFGDVTPNQWHDNVSDKLRDFRNTDFIKLDEMKKYAEDEIRQCAKRLGFSVEGLIIKRS